MTGYNFRWNNPNTWPKDTPECVFLARAIQQIGRAVKGDEWSNEINPGNIAIVSPGLPLRDQADATLQDKRSAALSVGKDVGTNNREPAQLTPKEWAQAQELRRVSIAKLEAKRKASHARLDLWSPVAEQVANALRQGRLESWMREPDETSMLGPQDREHWNIDDMSGCLSSCARNIAIGYSSKRRCYIFIGAQSLALFLETINAEKLPSITEPVVFDDRANSWSLFTCIAYVTTNGDGDTIKSIFERTSADNGKPSFGFAFRQVVSMLAMETITATGISPTHRDEIRGIPASVWGHVSWGEGATLGGNIVRSRVALDTPQGLWATATQLDIYVAEMGLPKWQDIRMNRIEFLDSADTNPGNSTSKLRGPKARYNWAAFDEKLSELMDYNGSIDAIDPEWNNRAKVINVMTDWCFTEWGDSHVPGETSIRQRVNKYLDK